MTETVKSNDAGAAERTADVLESGGVIVYPTETLYGVGALLSNKKGLERIFEIKGRPSGKPFPILVRDMGMMEKTVRLNGAARVLAGKFLPGALTMILKENIKLPEEVTSGGGKAAVRISGHSFVAALFEYIDEPLISTSANPSGSGNLTDYEDIRSAFEGEVDLIVNSGNISASKGSTIIDLTLMPPAIVREGDIKKEDITELLHGDSQGL